MADQPKAIENLMTEDRLFPPTDEFVAAASVGAEVYEEADADYLAFWKKQALNRVSWFNEPTVVLDDSKAPFFKWFTDGEINVSYNCLDRHLEDKGDKVAFHWIGEPGDTQDITYKDLYERVTKLANGLKSLGVEKGDRVAIYLGMVPELPVALLACATIGALHFAAIG